MGVEVEGVLATSQFCIFSHFSKNYVKMGGCIFSHLSQFLTIRVAECSAAENLFCNNVL